MLPGTMQAVVKAQAAPGVEIREVPVPQPGAGEVLVKVSAASVCGTDLHIYNWDQWAQGRIHPPLIPGHEFAGAVAAVGRGVTTVKEGDLVSAEMHVACGKCLQCRTGLAHVCQFVRILGVDANGAFASYAVIPESNIWKLSPGDSSRVCQRCSIPWATQCIRYSPARSPPRPWPSPAAEPSGCSRSPWRRPAARPRCLPSR